MLNPTVSSSESYMIFDNKKSDRQKQIDNWTHVFDKIQMDLQSLIIEKRRAIAKAKLEASRKSA